MLRLKLFNICNGTVDEDAQDQQLLLLSVQDGSPDHRLHDVYFPLSGILQETELQ